jgi:hypothetical protein
MNRNWLRATIIVKNCGECAEFGNDKVTYRCKETNERIMNKDQIQAKCPLDYVFEQKKESD